MNETLPLDSFGSARKQHKRGLMRGALLLLSAIALWAVCIEAIAQAYVYKPLVALDGGMSTAIGTGINDSGQVVGITGDTHSQYGTLWSGDTATPLEPNFQGYPSSMPSGINNAGQVVGRNNYSNAVVWSGGTRTDLPTLGGTSAAANAINDAGQIVGYSTTAAEAFYRATLWNGGTPIDLGTLNTPGALSSYAQGINAAGQIVGYTEDTDHSTHATLWNGLTAVELAPAGGTNSVASAINDAGQAVGGSGGNAILWNGTTPTTLGKLGGLVESDFATDINNSGQVVGYSSFLDLQDHATLWKGTKATDLNSFLDASTVAAGWVLENAMAINDKGWITGSAYNNTTFGRTAYLLMPVTGVPEASSTALMLAGLAAMALWARRRPGTSGRPWRSD